MNLPLHARTHSVTAPVRRRRVRAVTETSSQSGEAVSIWFGLGLPLVTFGSWLAGLLFLHPWLGFFLGLAISFFVGSRLIAAARH
jgi:uncharacterized membrane protein